MSKIELPPLRDVDTASFAYSGRSVDYINGYEAGYEAAADQLRARDRQIVEVCAQIATREMVAADETGMSEDYAYNNACQHIATAIRDLIEGSNNG